MFTVTGKAMARTWGVPDLKFLVMPHPIANLTPEQMNQRAVEIAPQAVDLLLKGAAGGKVIRVRPVSGTSGQSSG